jgi:hypothetical protein
VRVSCGCPRKPFRRAILSVDALDQPVQFDSVGSYLLVSWWLVAGLASLAVAVAVAEVINRGHAMRTELDTVI